MTWDKRDHFAVIPRPTTRNGPPIYRRWLVSKTGLQVYPRDRDGIAARVMVTWARHVYRSDRARVHDDELKLHCSTLVGADPDHFGMLVPCIVPTTAAPSK